MSNTSRVIGCGVFLRDSSGGFIFAFTNRLNSYSVIEAELWGIYHGFFFAWNKGYKKVVVESNSSLAIELLSALNGVNHLHQLLINGIEEIGEGEGEWMWKKIDRQNNHVADMLAKYYFQLDTECSLFESPPEFLL